MLLWSARGCRVGFVFVAVYVCGSVRDWLGFALWCLVVRCSGFGVRFFVGVVRLLWMPICVWSCRRRVLSGGGCVELCGYAVVSFDRTCCCDLFCVISFSVSLSGLLWCCSERLVVGRRLAWIRLCRLLLRLSWSVVFGRCITRWPRRLVQRSALGRASSSSSRVIRCCRPRVVGPTAPSLCLMPILRVVSVLWYSPGCATLPISVDRRAACACLCCFRSVSLLARAFFVRFFGYYSVVPLWRDGWGGGRVSRGAISLVASG